MKYIGPFFRMNSLSQKEINGQLFYLSKEAIKTLTLESKCGLVSSIKNFTKASSSIDITTIGNFSPLLCIYRKASPNFIHSKNTNGFDEDTFRKEINPTTNALMTLSLLELLDYYRCFKDVDKANYSLYEIYKVLTKEQLEFYSVNLRNTEGVFIDKKNMLENNTKNFSLVEKDKKFKFSDQAFMMVSYYAFWYHNPHEEVSKAYKTFALEILQMFIDFKEKVYECSMDELCKTLLALNILYTYNPDNELCVLITDLTDYAMNKFDEKDYYVEALDTAALCAITLTLSYKHTNIISFLDKTKIIIDRLYTLYDAEKEVFYKLSSKKDLKYSSFDITFYFLAFVLYGEVSGKQSEYKNLISSIYKKYFISSGLIPSWPDAPTLDDYERYRGLTLSSSDMLDESYFRMPNIPNPQTSGIASIINKSLDYYKKKNSFSINKLVFDSYKNFMIFYLFIHFFKNDYISEMNLVRNNLTNATIDTRVDNTLVTESEPLSITDGNINTNIVSTDLTDTTYENNIE